ncbi:MAG: leucine--tRNA ligase [Candidatus Zambryskibacteria bacterium CG22_combo_CG10-13_8_21_14_all_42_17]|uniref:Leucine--tRNA ligase n=1 Tax=Candidatus Zambryskibacteria bacterium CG22_combo_CG10-13_8_21_14_all_42_17 TaxID=1975118 RepID=A0A2H0BDG0_9BACT|nr:MAG: leucine--tRNA ligase [Candidatus Zambryskibacteria bacterium CG22_combo_CG10-13_8_21_14_all_42_17]
MVGEYNPKEIEGKWQKEWEKSGMYHADDNSKKPKYYSLVEFPYPSGDGLHVGHVRSYTAMDIIARKRRMEGFNVLYPIGWDAFGLPTENYAIKTGRPPKEITKENSDTFRVQLKSLGLSFDWSREINTTDPKYYKWTQWIFLKFLEKGLAYKKKMPINWCPNDKIGLANEEVIDGKCERCGTEVEQKEKEQWMLAITKYADRLIDDLDLVDFPERVKIQQKNWIGKSIGAEIDFNLDGGQTSVKVFTTRPDTIFGATFLVKAGKEDKFTGRYAINPATKEVIPIWEAEYVLSDYGTGAIMGVPADDERDMEFAKKYNLPIVEDYTKAGFEEFGKKTTKYKLRDWIFSRQRYWGEPIPVIHCGKCGVVPVPEKDLPVKLPKLDKYVPGPDGESPLANISEWVNVNCPSCGIKAKRETDVMPNWAGSSWYFLRYCDHENGKEFASMKKLQYFMPVDWYNGGMEHTVLHLLYSRFWNKFLYDLGLVSTSEPYKKRTSHGLILAEGGEKMSKSKGNVINPDSIVAQFGADTLRLYEMFMGPFEQALAWSEDSLVGPRRFLEKVWRLQSKISRSEGFTDVFLTNQTIKKISEDIEKMGFNTAVSAMMVFANALDKQEKVTQKEFEVLLLILAPFAPHITEELWHKLGNVGSIHKEPWPLYDSEKLERNEVTLVVQINGKVRASLYISRDTGEEETKSFALNLPEIKKWLNGKEPKKVIVVPERVVSIVT